MHCTKFSKHYNDKKENNNEVVLNVFTLSMNTTNDSDMKYQPLQTSSFLHRHSSFKVDSILKTNTMELKEDSPI